ncbi:MAG: large conductance mechanosensitive channel protein MscL [Anaerolineae bacterium]|nr:large conductance mechanosensitive channel protein MscL [Anaerolineae bacterium]MCO5192341.1 large conductance mechanosensitive channel protein MscL [Anaerolineae bacterium]MCO5197557.1 large conductance mechanosensitive channel protein MscL [Anaerolineae bacterium]MCO5203820.1 large conductance mechanosensitive channel protein MscL [Anaerolineae bacterium]
MIKEFKAFIMRGNVLDLAVAVVIGAAFGAIITSFVNDLIMPIVSVLTGGVAFADLFYAIDGNTYATLADAQEAGAAVLAYGSFIQTVVNFVIIAFAIFLVVKAANSMKKEEEEEAAPDPGPSAEETLLTEIRDLLAKK